MKNGLFTKLVLHSVLYTLIALSLYLLYSPLNDHPKNKAGSSTQFVYQQF